MVCVVLSVMDCSDDASGGGGCSDVVLGFWAIFFFRSASLEL